MVPIQFKKMIRETCAEYVKGFDEMLVRSIGAESSNLSIVMCSESDLKVCLQKILSVVPKHYLHDVAKLLRIDTFRMPITHKLRLLPLFNVDYISTALGELSNVKSVNIHILDVEDEFVFHGSHAEVFFKPSETPKGVVVGGYLQITFDDETVTVITISPEELEEARVSWEQCVFGRKVGSDIYQLVLLLRAFKTLLSFQGVEIHKAFVSLCEGLMGFMEDAFGEYKMHLNAQFKLSGKFAHFVGGERSRLEQIVDELPTPQNVLLGKTVSPVGTVKTDLEQETNVVNVQFGVKQGW